MTAPIRDRSVAALDVPRAQLEARVRVEASAAKLRWLLAHPEAVATAPHATEGEAAEYRHLLYDADSDASTEPFPYPAPKEATV